MPTDRRRSLVLLLLTLGMALSVVDRLAFGLCLQDIKKALHLSDTELGLLTGLAFALFYSVLGIPIARLADRGNRTTIITVSALLWGALVAACGAATNFLWLMLLRIGVSIGEAGYAPPANSLIADFYERDDRPRAFTIFALAGPIAAFIGYFLAGWLNELLGWRQTFFLLGAPGAIFAVAFFLLVYDPRRHGQIRPDKQTSAALPNYAATTRELTSNRTFANVALYNVITCFFGFGIAQWTPVYFLRTFGIRTGELGTWLSVILSLGGMVGVLFGGRLAAWLGKGSERLQLKVMAAFAVVGAILYLGIFTAQNKYVAFSILGVFAITGAVSAGPIGALKISLVPEHSRAFSVAALGLLQNLLGLGVGPLCVGALSDLLRPWAGEASLRWAILIFTPGFVWGAAHLWFASRTVVKDLEIEAEGQPNG